MKKSLRAFLVLAVALLVVGCAAPGGGGLTPNRGGATTSTGGLEYVFTPDVSYFGGPSLFGLTYGNGKYVAVGTSGTVIASSDGTDWNLTEQRARSIAKTTYSDKGHLTRARFIAGSRAAVGSGIAGKKLPAGRTLIDSGYSSDISGNLLGVAYGAGKFVAIGDDGFSWSSTDGTSWTQVGGVSLGWFTSIAFLNGKFVAFGYDGDYVVLTSSDGSAWSSAPMSTSDFCAGSAYGNGIYVAVVWSGSGSPIFTSTNGSNDWTAVSNGSILLPASLYQSTESGYESDIELTGVAFHDGVFVAVGTAVSHGYESDRNVPLILVSTDGINWSSQDLPDLTPSGLGGNNIEAGLTGVAATDAGFVAVGDFYTYDSESTTFASSIVLTSTTGRSWQHDYYNSSLSGAVASGNGMSAIGLGDNLLDWW
jgi:hypothetical protein